MFYYQKAQELSAQVPLEGLSEQRGEANQEGLAENHFRNPPSPLHSLQLCECSFFHPTPDRSKTEVSILGISGKSWRPMVPPWEQRDGMKVCEIDIRPFSSSFPWGPSEACSQTSTPGRKWKASSQETLTRQRKTSDASIRGLLRTQPDHSAGKLVFN